MLYIEAAVVTGFSIKEGLVHSWNIGGLPTIRAALAVEKIPPHKIDHRNPNKERPHREGE